MKTQEIRQHFLNYFKNKGHKIVPSSPVVPHEDPTLLFTNAGMNQFKDVFLGSSVRDYNRASTSQKCIRAGGKHNDLENVGHTSRHLTFFEMLGNFSFGDYFKKEAIAFAWELSTEHLKIDPKYIWATVFREDDEAFNLWLDYLPAERIVRFDEKDNFWAMGDTGPCGPCSELYFDRGEKYGSAPSPREDTTGDRYIEFWNLVFMQYNRQADGTMERLPKPSIDTGAGIERIASLLLGVDSVFETDVLRGLIGEVEHFSGKKYDLSDNLAPAFRVIADHLRSLAFAIADGAQPSNVDRGYVLRKILRRAVRYGRTLGFDEPFLAKLLPKLQELMGEDYPELKKAHERISEILTIEEEAFIRTLRRGGNLLNQIIENAQKQHKPISGDDAFKLKDTYGLPIEEILLIAKDSSLEVDLKRFQELENEAKERSRNVQKTSKQIASENLFKSFEEKQGPSQFLGYSQLTSPAKVTALVVNGEFVDKIREGEEGLVILNQTPFYAEMGGQIGDTGTLTSNHQLFVVENCQSPLKGISAHVGKLVKGNLHVGDMLTAGVDAERRQNIANNHTATHLLHWALHLVLGEHIKQAGSVVDANRLRFDFSHHKALTQDEIQRIENLINEKIRENLSVNTYELDFDEVQKRQEIKQFFGDKYGSKVRVVDIDYSKELCGGTHTTALGNIGLFRIAKESSIAAGVRRIEAVTGAQAEAFARESDHLLEVVSVLLKTQPTKLQERINKLIEENKQLTQDLKNAKRVGLQQQAETLVAGRESVNSLQLVAAELDGSPADLQACAEEVLIKMPSGVVALISKADDKCHLFIRISDDLVAKGLKANEAIKTLAPLIGGTGGGKPNSAQAGGKSPENIPLVLEKLRELLQQQ